MINSLCEGASELLNLSNILDLASHKAFVTGEWYIPGHKLIGFLIEFPASIGGELSKGESTVDFTGIDISSAEALALTNPDFLENRAGVAAENDLL